MRPRRTGKDDNHNIPRDFFKHACGGCETEKFGFMYAYTANYRGVRYILIDISGVGGALGDYILENTESGRVAWLECKTEEAYRARNNSLQPGEQWLKDRSPNFVFIVTDDDMIRTMESL